jgi:predicted DNA-binding transcriptional regulator AlpA
MGNTTTISTEQFKAECERRLIDSYDLMTLIGIRSREGVWKRVQAGTLPAPVVHSKRQFALWDRDELPELPDKKEK